jgi:BCD family chlorophyll transporter-like MFS transporter
VLVGMLLATLAGRTIRGRSTGSLKLWTIWGCVCSGIAMGGLVLAGLIGPSWPFTVNVVLLGMANGAFSIAAIGSMMALASEGRDSSEGVRMGLWGASQAVAFGLGGLVGTAASDLARWLISTPGHAYACVFAGEALMFFISARLAWRVGARATTSTGSNARPSLAAGPELETA